MDLNYLYGRHQIELVRAEQALCEASKAAHQSLAALYWEQIQACKDAAAFATNGAVPAAG